MTRVRSASGVDSPSQASIDALLREQLRAALKKQLQKARSQAQREQIRDRFRKQYPEYAKALGVAGEKTDGKEARVEKLLKEARKWLGASPETAGNNENPFSRYFNRPPEAWCADFVSYLMEVTGAPVGEKGEGFPGVAAMQAWFESKGGFHTDNPKPGDVIFFGQGRHVGIVESVKNGTVYTIEGNSSDGVRKRDYPLSHPDIAGYGSRWDLGEFKSGGKALDVGDTNMSGPTTSSPGALGGDGTVNAGSPQAEGAPSGVDAEDPDQLTFSERFFQRMFSSLMQMNEDTEKKVSDLLLKNSGFRRFAHKALGAKLQGKTVPAWLASNFVEAKLEEVARTPEGRKSLEALEEKKGDALVKAVIELITENPDWTKSLPKMRPHGAAETIMQSGGVQFPVRG